MKRKNHKRTFYIKAVKHAIQKDKTQNPQVNTHKNKFPKYTNAHSITHTHTPIHINKQICDFSFSTKATQCQKDFLFIQYVVQQQHQQQKKKLQKALERMKMLS
jgi:hypothetical protein